MEDDGIMVLALADGRERNLTVNEAQSLLRCLKKSDATVMLELESALIER
jgi:hypothetical protein